MEEAHRPKKRKPHKFGAGISLEKFGKLKKSSFDKRAQQEKQRKLNAAQVNKYKKLKQKLVDKLNPKIKVIEEDLDVNAQQQPASPQQQQQHVQQDATGKEQGGEHRHGGTPFQQRHEGGCGQCGRGAGWGGRSGQDSEEGSGKRHKPQSHMQRIAAKVQVEKEAKQHEHEERQRAFEERRAKLAADARQRAAKSKLLYKKTGHGQPVMKYRVEKMLAQLQQ